MSPLAPIKISAAEMQEKAFSYLYNVKDEFKSLTKEEIITKLRSTANGFSVCMSQIIGDFNFAGIVRSANFFNANEVFYFGHKKYDRRGTCGSHCYIDVNHIPNWNDLIKLKEAYTFVALENSKGSVPLNSFDWKVCNKLPLILIGEEGNGLSEELLAECEHIVEIMNCGSVRSLNASVAGAIAMNDFVSKK